MRNLLLTAATLITLPAVAALTPKSYPDYQVTSVSPNGKFAVSQFYGTLIVMNLETGEEKTWQGNEEGTVAYGVGNGNVVSNDGTVVGYIDYSSGAVYYLENNEWHQLPTIVEGTSNIANAITPDGRIICGGNGLTSISTDDNPTPMSVPVLWIRGEDGNFGKPVELPYPTTDITGRVPQYVTAIALSDDGSTVLGQVRDYSGRIHYPIVYTNNNGEWTYSLPAMSLVNPDNIELPQDPGEGPAAPKAEDFLSPEEKTAFEKALEEWENKNGGSSNPDFNSYPDVNDFLGEESKARYDEAYDEYIKANAAWEEKAIAFYTAFDKLLISGLSFEFNIGSLSADGKTAWQSARKIIDTGNPENQYKEAFAPATIDLTTGEIFIRDFSQDASMTFVAEDGTIFATKRDQLEGIVYSPDVNTILGIPFIEYVENINPETAKWVNENMRHDFVGTDPETFEPIDRKDVICSGFTICSRDQSVLISRAINYWEDTPVIIYSYVLPGKIDNAGIALNPAEDMGVTISKDGVIHINGEVVSLTVSDINGRVIYDGRPASDTIETGIGNGAYIISAIGADGSLRTAKVLL